MKKTATTYCNAKFCITINEEIKDSVYISVHNFGEPCNGILKHWGTRESLIKELEEIISEIKKI
jgi:hypothetical protein